MKKIIYILILLSTLVTAYYYYKNSNKLKISNLSDLKYVTICSKSYLKEVNSKYAVIDENKVLVKKDLDSFREFYVLDGCTGRKIEIYAGPVTSSVENNIIFNLDNKYIISMTNGGAYEDIYKNIYYVNLSEVKDTLTYIKLDLNLKENETLLNYDLSCGEGCDKETRVFSATVMGNKINIDVFDSKLKEKKIILNKEILVNKKIRTINLDISSFK